MSRRGRARARWLLFGGWKPPPPRRREQMSGRRFLAALCRARWRDVAQLLFVLVIGALCGLFSGRAQAGDLPAPVVVPEVVPAGLPKVLEPFVDILDRDGWVSDDEAALLPYQRAWVYDRAKLKIAAKSRRIGITWATAYEAVEVAASRRDAGGLDVWYMANSLDDAREFIEDCADWVEWLKPIVDGLAASAVLEETLADTDRLVDDIDKDVRVFSIRFSSGFKIHALTSKPRRLRGKSGYAILDEAAFHDNLWAWLKAAGAFAIWGGRVAIISTFSGVENAFFELVEAAEAGRKKASVHRVDIFQALDQGLYRRICQRQEIEWTREGEQQWLQETRTFYGDDFDEECGCIPKRSGGAYIPRDMVHGRMLRPSEGVVFPYKGEQDWHLKPEAERKAAMRQWLDKVVRPALVRMQRSGLDFYAGVDFGRIANLTVLTVLGLRKDMVRSAELIIELENVPFDQQDQVLEYVWQQLGSRLRKVCLDAGGLGRPSAERTQSSLGESRAELVSLGEAWYAAHWPPLRGCFEQSLIDLPLWQPLLEDLAQVRRVGGKVQIVAASPQREGGGGRQHRHADGAVSLLLAEAAVGTRASRETIGERYGLSGKGKRR